MLLKIVVVIAGYHAFVGLMYLLLGTRPASILLTPHRLVRDVFVKLFLPGKPALWKQRKEEEKKAKQLAVERSQAEVEAAMEELRSFEKKNATIMEEHERLRKKRSAADNSLWDAKHQHITDNGFQGVCAG